MWFTVFKLLDGSSVNFGRSCLREWKIYCLASRAQNLLEICALDLNLGPKPCGAPRKRYSPSRPGTAGNEALRPNHHMPLQCRQAGSAPQSGHSLFAISSPCASPSSIQTHGRKKGSLLRFSRPTNKWHINLICAVGVPLPATLSGSRPPGRTPPNVGARTHCPNAKARAGSNTKHGLPHSTCTPLTSLLTNGPKGERAQLTRFPVRFAEGHTEAVGGEPARPCPRGRAGALSLCPVSTHR